MWGSGRIKYDNVVVVDDDDDDGDGGGDGDDEEDDNVADEDVEDEDVEDEDVDDDEVQEDEAEEDPPFVRACASKCTWTFHKSHFAREFTWKMPGPRWSTLIKHGPALIPKEPLSVHTLFGET